MTRIEAVRRTILLDLTPWQRLSGIAVAIAVPATLRWALGQAGEAVPFAPFFPFVLLAAVFMGWRAALVVAIITTLLVEWVFRGGSPSLLDPHRLTLALLIALANLALIAVGDTLRRTVRQLDALAREQDIVAREMYHRVQNALGVVQALIRVSHAGDDTERFRQDLLARVQALANANRLLDNPPGNTNGAQRRNVTEARQPADGAGLNLAQLVRTAIAPFHKDDAFHIEGPPFLIEREPAYHLLLVLHELCTNALKHGALSDPRGRVSIGWSADGVLLWRENGGPPVLPPSRQGLGTRMFARQQHWTLERDFAPSGLTCRIALRARATVGR
ncbi:MULTISPECIES: HWE histidine kinase domain-containing protein [unclassified Novosphingobium]|uniref:sensor histidine kinase n=1 Tax=unclassified Novosphingobium TaxID=2644732 RepID=UPI001494C4F4|nr:two-component sensor histidine kinase [Novosphingobium sp. BK256]MBB3374027.1 two-component sensor histidine kinase [Novosphingobium sp. BK280]MBB3378439.1 two-component sensor histidine kinase [Novosphingobium sp. BK258]MBB3419777.1 two-component sensor histidine kinase [Novosphingobium sp. BK267]MBB3447902.1 two-component sensor histidine kinase [Novosphingobium sp. BK352]MBB3477309.1 two-component sensor histidine kinase [Novosphingobium sp. BK369]MBB3500259.1 two-component sensor histi